MNDAEFIRNLVRLVHGENLVEAIDVLVKDKGYKMEAIAKRLEADDKLRTAAEAVIKRWDTTEWDWYKEGPTASLIAELRRAMQKGPQ